MFLIREAWGLPFPAYLVRIMRPLFCSVLFATMLAKAYAAVGLPTELVIANSVIAPDGYTRSYVTGSPCCFGGHRSTFSLQCQSCGRYLSRRLNQGKQGKLFGKLPLIFL
jgi:hypothetical protein